MAPSRGTLFREAITALTVTSAGGGPPPLEGALTPELQGSERGYYAWHPGVRRIQTVEGEEEEEGRARGRALEGCVAAIDLGFVLNPVP